MNINEQYMLRCIELAQKGAGSVSPNPMVGAVLVHNGVIIGEGWHQKYGGPHAEVNCIASVTAADQHLIAESTLYVSLEPCAHFGKTPPCADLIITKKIPHVVVGCVDTYSEVSGKGIALLQAAGIKVTTDVLQSECRNLNKRFFTFHEKQRPYIILKWAQSADGFIGPVGGKKVMLSGWATQRLVHKLRSLEDSIMVGFRTALLDNPLLNNRLWTGRNPIRVVWDKFNTLPETHHLKDGSIPTFIFNNKSAEIQDKYISIEIPEAQNDISFLLRELKSRNIQSIIIEGGTDTLNSFINAGLWDEAIVVTAQKTNIGHGVKSPTTTGFHLKETTTIGNDSLKFYTMNNHEDYLVKNKAAWNERTKYHVDSEFYNTPAFLAGATSLRQPELDLLGDIKGKSILHLQCHFGQDTLSLARMGAMATGVDLSDAAIGKAQELNEQLGLDAKFICSDVYALPTQLDEQFDIVFTSYGTIGWLPDLDKWANIIHRYLKPGGKFVFVEFHPLMWIFDSKFSYIQYPYFNTETIIETNEGTYADREAPIKFEEISWNHSLDEVIGSLLAKGLQLSSFKEYDYSPYNCFEGMEQVGENKYVIQSIGNKIPMLYSLTANKR